MEPNKGHDTSQNIDEILDRHFSDQHKIMQSFHSETLKLLTQPTNWPAFAHLKELVHQHALDQEKVQARTLVALFSEMAKTSGKKLDPSINETNIIQRTQSGGSMFI
jgi:hypothetical protein